MAVEEITVDELASRLEDGAVLLDVRESEELAQERVPGVHHIPLAEVVERSAEIPDGDLYVICRSGARSMAACEQLASVDREARNVAGGTIAWVRSGRPVESG